MTKRYERIGKIWSSRSIAIALMLVLTAAMIPVLYLTTVNHSTGDDLGYGKYVHAYVSGQGGFSSVFDALGKTLKQYYIGWQGTWFSIILFALQPGVLNENLYVLVAPMALLLWFGSTYYLFGYILREWFGYDRWSFIAITTLFLLLTVEFIPSTKSSIFWYNGVAHYMIPFALCQIAITWMLKFANSKAGRPELICADEGKRNEEDSQNCMNEGGKQGSKGKWSYFAGICILMSLLGGSSYQCALFALIPCLYIIINRRRFALFVPLFLEIIGLAISALAPGNRVRGGEEFGFSISKALSTVVLSFAKEGQDFVKYIVENPILAAGCTDGIFSANVLLFMTDVIQG